MSRLTTDQWLGTLLGDQQSSTTAPKDEEALAALLLDRSTQDAAAAAQPSPGWARLPPDEEARFQRDMREAEGYRQWREQFAAKNGGEPNLDDPDYDYRAAWKAGIRPAPYEHDGGTYHWSSSLPDGQMLKSERHPTAWMEHFMRATGEDPNAVGVRSKEEGERYIASRGHAPLAAGPAPALSTPKAHPASGEAKSLASPASRVDSLISSLQRPTQDDMMIASVFDGMLGGNRYSDDVRGRRNQYDQALIGAHAADAAAAERAAEAERSRGLHREQMDVQRRGQDVADARAREDRALRDLLAGRRDTASMERQKERDEAALERAKIVKAGGGGPALTPEQTAERDAKVADMELGYLAGRASMPGKAPVTIETVRQYQAGALPPGTLSADEEEGIKRGQAYLAGMKTLNKDEYARTLKGGEIREAGTPDKIGTPGEIKKLDPKAMGKAREELLEMAGPIREAVTGWSGLSDDAKEILVQYGGAGESKLIGALKTAALKPEEQVAAARIQRLVNVDVKRFAGSAVTGSEWGRQAQAIGLPVGDFDPWKSPAVLHDYLRKMSGAYKNLKNNYQTTYPEIFNQGGGK